MPFDPYKWLRLKYEPENIEFGKKDPVIEQGRWRLFYPTLKEYDRYEYDPPVKNSRNSWIDGEDGSYNPSGMMISKYMGMTVDEWRYKVLYRKNPAIKNIYDKWDISDEHPGMDFRTFWRAGNEPGETHGGYLGGWGILKRITTFGMPQYFDSPAGEQCFPKAYMCARAMATLMIPIWLNDVAGITQPEGWKNITRRYFAMSGAPIIGAWMFGAVSCLVSSYRNTDDLIDRFWGVFGYASVFYFSRGVYSSIRAFSVSLPIVWTWRYFVDSEDGIHSRQEIIEGHINDAMFYKRKIGGRFLPEEPYH